MSTVKLNILLKITSFLILLNILFFSIQFSYTDTCFQAARPFFTHHVQKFEYQIKFGPHAASPRELQHAQHLNFADTLTLYLDNADSRLDYDFQSDIKNLFENFDLFLIRSNNPARYHALPKIDFAKKQIKIYYRDMPKNELSFEKNLYRISILVRKLRARALYPDDSLFYTNLFSILHGYHHVVEKNYFTYFARFLGQLKALKFFLFDVDFVMFDKLLRTEHPQMAVEYLRRKLDGATYYRLVAYFNSKTLAALTLGALTYHLTAEQSPRKGDINQDSDLREENVYFFELNKLLSGVMSEEDHSLTEKLIHLDSQSQFDFLQDLTFRLGREMSAGRDFFLLSH